MDGHLAAVLGGADADILAAISLLALTRVRVAEPRRLRVAQHGSAALRVGDAVRVAFMARRARRSSLGQRLIFRRATSEPDWQGTLPPLRGRTGRAEVGGTVPRPRPPCFSGWS